MDPTQQMKPGYYWFRKRVDCEWEVAKISTNAGVTYVSLSGGVYTASYYYINQHLPEHQLLYIPTPDEQHYDSLETESGADEPGDHSECRRAAS